MVALAVVAVVAAGGLAHVRVRDCGSGDGDGRGPNAPCTRAKDCDDGLSCAGGVCVAPDAGAEAAATAAQGVR